jgi:hypothetical protein
VIGGYAVRHTDTAGQVHTWTCNPSSVHWVARWHAQDSGQPTEVLRDDGDGWRQVAVWTAGNVDEPPPMDWSYPDDGCLWDDADLGRPVGATTWTRAGYGDLIDCDDLPDEEGEILPWCRPIVDYAAL